MKAKLITTALLFFSILNTNAQTHYFNYAKQTGNTGEDIGYSIATDIAGNIFTMGTFTGTVDFDPGTGTSNLSGGGTFISKLDVSGNFIWAKQLIVSGVAMCIDQADNIYITGNFGGTRDFDPGPNVINMTSHSGTQTDIFICKLTSAGNFIWAKQMGGPYSINIVVGIACDNNNNPYITGYFRETCDFDPGPNFFNLYNINTSMTFYDMFVASLSNAGNFRWAKQFGGVQGAGEVVSIAVSDSNEVYTTGFYIGEVDFNPGAGVDILSNTQGSNWIYISKLDSNGNHVWVKEIAGNWMEVFCITTFQNSVYLTGDFYGTADFDPGVNIANLTALAQNDVYVCKLNSAGNYQWAKKFGGVDLEAGYTIDCDNLGNVYTAGLFNLTVDFDPGSNVYNLISANGSDGFISQLDSSGNFMSAKLLSGNSIYHGITQIHIDNFNNILLTGGFQGTWDFNPDTAASFNLTTAGVTDIFISKLATCISPTGSIQLLTNDTVCKGDTAKIKINPNQPTTYQWYKNGSVIAGATSQQLNVTAAGKYKSLMTNANGCTKFSGVKTIVLRTLPASTITAAGPTTFCVGQSVVLNGNTATGLTYQWKKNGGNLGGATLANYTATIAGNYKRLTTDAFGCNKTSNLIAVIVPCKEGNVAANNFEIEIAPNPFKEKITLQISLSYQQKISILFTDILGNKIESLSTDKILNEGNHEINFSADFLTAGIYLCSVKTDDGKTVTRKVVKIE